MPGFSDRPPVRSVSPLFLPRNIEHMSTQAPKFLFVINCTMSKTRMCANKRILLHALAYVVIGTPIKNKQIL
jgi:hypothetical protein